MSGWLSDSFALDPALTLLNHGSFGACPRPVIEAREREGRAMEADPLGYMAGTASRIRVALQRLGPWVGARGEDLVLVDNASSGIATVVRSLALRAGDRVVTTSHGYGGVRQTIHAIARPAGAVVVEVPVPFPVPSAQAVLDAVVPHLPGARLVVLDWITSPTGVVMPIGALMQACRAAGVPVLIDGAHAPGQVPMDLEGLGADWVTGNLHKWMFAPKGTALLWARPDRQAALLPLVPSHDTPRGWPWAWDWTGTRDMSGWMALPDVLDWVEGVGASAIMAHNDRLADEAAQLLAEAWEVAVPVPRSLRAALAAIPAPGVGADRAQWLHDALRAKGLEVACIPFAGRTWVRISGQVYNHLGQYERLAEVVRTLVA